MSEIRRAYLSLGGRQLHYRAAGTPGAPALLLLHQTPSTSAMYDPLLRQWRDRYYLIAPDNPGFGGSDPLAQGYGVPDIAACFLALLDELAVETCFVFGHHSGAAIAVQLAVDYPGRCRALALSGPTLLDAEQRRSLPEQVGAVAPEPEGGHLLGMWQRLRARDPDAPLELIQREVLSALASGHEYRNTYRAVCAQEFADLLPVVDCPVLVFAGDEDPLRVGVEPSLALLQQGQTAALPPGCRTYVCERQAEELAGILGAFFESVEERG